MPEIITDKDILRKISYPVNDLDLEANDIIEQLLKSIPNNALGLSAPQIGIHKRAFLANLSDGSYAFINPRITWESPFKIPSVESCLSLPNITCCIERHYAIKISADRIIKFDGKSSINILYLRGMDSFIIQHEYDHLNGILIIDLPPIEKNVEKTLVERDEDRKKRIMLRRQSRKAQKNSIVEKKPQKINEKKQAKLQKTAKKKKRAARRARKREQIRVEIQERYRAEQEGLLKKQNI